MQSRKDILVSANIFFPLIINLAEQPFEVHNSRQGTSELENIE